MRRVAKELRSELGLSRDSAQLMVELCDTKQHTSHVVNCGGIIALFSMNQTRVKGWIAPWYLIACDNAEAMGRLIEENLVMFVEGCKGGRLVVNDSSYSLRWDCLQASRCNCERKIGD